MSLSISGNDPTARTSFSTDDDKKTTGQPQRAHAEFDFAGKAYAAVHLPTGLISAPPKGQIKQDARDLTESANKIADDLKSPELRHLLWEGTKVGWYSGFVLKDTIEVADKAAGACEGNLLSLAQCAKAMVELGHHSIELAKAANELKKADTPEARAKAETLLHHVETLAQQMAKLEVDIQRHFGAQAVAAAKKVL